MSCGVKEQQQCHAIEITSCLLFTGVTQHCVILQSWNSTYTKRFLYALAIIWLLAKDRNKYCCWYKIY